MKKVTHILQVQDVNVQGVSADDQERKQKVQYFRDHRYDVLVTTTILERGVTIQDVQVGVLGAESPVFSESALVQISVEQGDIQIFLTETCIFSFWFNEKYETSKETYRENE